MKPLSFLSRFAFICNVLFVVCVVIKYTHDFIGQTAVNNVIITLGWLIAPLVNIVVNCWYLARLIKKKPLYLPFWLVVANFVLLVIQFFIYFIIPA